MIIAEGKTKRITAGSQPGTVIIETFDVLTGGDAAKRAVIDEIGALKTAQTANTFTLLNALGLPTAFIERMPNALLCHRCEMLPLEFVVRRYAWGSYFLRNPAQRREGAPPLRFEEPICEIFHKHAVVAAPPADAPMLLPEDQARELYLKDGVWAKGVYTDPYVETVPGAWLLHPPKQPVVADEGLLSIPPLFDEGELRAILDGIIRPVFLALERAWAAVETVHGPVVLADLKIELGRRADGQIVLADVIDNDSWRIWPGGDPANQLDKQCFREDHPLGEVADKYRLVTKLTEGFAR